MTQPLFSPSGVEGVGGRGGGLDGMAIREFTARSTNRMAINNVKAACKAAFYLCPRRAGGMQGVRLPCERVPCMPPAWAFGGGHAR